MDSDMQRTGLSGIGDQGAEVAELIAKMEKLTGPDRELDALIYCARNPNYTFVRFERWNQHAGRLYYKIEGIIPECQSDGFPLYTASTDAAQTLVPEACAWQCGCEIDFTPTARVWGHDINANEFAATPAIALCIAAIRARAALSKAETT